jgi:hypothetical protein
MYGNSGTLKVGIVEINDAMIDSYRDKNLPRKETGATPLPGTMIRRIPFPLSVDTLRLHNTNIVYTEVNPELGTTTIVPVNHLEGTVYPIRNTGLQTQDSLHIYAEAKILDTLAVSLRVKESYNDSMQGFHMQVKMRPVDLRVLNPVLEPATRVQLRSGYLDSLSMRVTGREALAFGEIDFHYHDLKVKVLPKAGENRKRGFLSFIVNSFIVKNKNRKTGTAFYVRDRQRSAINYLVRILMSGITNSVGAKNHKKEMRPYAKEISSTALPGE